jgi:glycosyltransferase involved in cell wall biosynthesis
MRSNDSSGPSASRNTCDQATPGWLFVLPWSPRRVGGVNQAIKSLVVQFRNGGVFSPQLLVSSESESDAYTQPELIKPNCLDLWSPVDHQHPFRALLSFVYRLPRRCWVAVRIINQYNIRIINPHFPGLESLLFLVLKKLRLFRGRIILTFHGSDVRNALSTKGRERRLWRTLLRGADHIVVVSDDLAKGVLAMDSTAAAKMKTIYNGADLALFAPSEEETARIPLPNHGKTILSIGAFIPLKGHDVLIRAFGHVRSQVPGARLVLVGGDGPEIEPIRQLINSMSLEHTVIIFKDAPHERIPEFLSQAQVFVLASRREGSPLVVIEAAAAKVPVVCTKAGGMSELIIDGLTGRLVAIDDHIALADAIVDVLKYPDDARRMAVKLYEYVSSNLTWRHVYEKYLQLAGDGVSHDVPMAESASQ